jgi:hypothetical protein
MSTVAQQPQTETPASAPAEQSRACSKLVIQLDLVPLDQVYTVSVDGRQVGIQLFHMVDELATLATTDIVRLMSHKGFRPAYGSELAALNSQHPDALQEEKAIISLGPLLDSSDNEETKCPAIRKDESGRTSYVFNNCNKLFIRGPKIFFAMVRK